MIKQLIQEENITFVNMYVANIYILGSPKFIKTDISKGIVRNAQQCNSRGM